jgi:hypothetical protein
MSWDVVKTAWIKNAKPSKAKLEIAGAMAYSAPNRSVSTFLEKNASKSIKGNPVKKIHFVTVL